MVLPSGYSTSSYTNIFLAERLRFVPELQLRNLYGRPLEAVFTRQQ